MTRLQRPSQAKAQALQLSQRLEAAVADRDKAIKRAATLEAAGTELQAALDVAKGQVAAATAEADRAAAEAHEQRARADAAHTAARKEAQGATDRLVREERSKVRGKRGIRDRRTLDFVRWVAYSYLRLHKNVVFAVCTPNQSGHVLATSLQARDALQRAQQAAEREADLKAALAQQAEQVSTLQATLREAKTAQEHLSRQLHDCQVRCWWWCVFLGVVLVWLSWRFAVLESAYNRPLLLCQRFVL